jgi:two-component system nitrogen regulation sensor histidine kinase NtrY
MGSTSKAYSPYVGNLSASARDTTPLKKVFRSKIAVRILIICLCGWLTVFLFFFTTYWMAAIWIAITTVGCFFETVRFVGQSERKLSSFLQSLSQNDFSQTFYESKGSDNYDLHRAFNQLNDTFKSLRLQKESQHQLLQSIVQAASVPMICFHPVTEEVFLVNDAAKTLFHVPFLRDIKTLARSEHTLPAFIRSIKEDEKELLNFSAQGKNLVLSVSSRHMVFENKVLKLVAFHDVSSELARKEADTWHRLLRVLTHEISNSAIPLSTLSSFVYELLYGAEHENRILSAEERTDVMSSLRTIEQRSKSLKEFVHNFKIVNRIPEPEILALDIRIALQEAIGLFKKVCDDEGIKIRIDHTADPVFVLADHNLTLQVLINLVKNAVESFGGSGDKLISISFERTGRYIHLKIHDTGSGIRPDDLEQIFIPFFSTKKTGSGIGLSVSQQIMQKQKGDIKAESEYGKGSLFTLSFISCADIK